MSAKTAVLLFYAIILFFIFAVIVNLFMKYKNFSREYRRLGRRVKYSSGEDKKHWIRKRRKLWFMWIPFYKEKKKHSNHKHR